jgi:hypothetical protein
MLGQCRRVRHKATTVNAHFSSCVYQVTVTVRQPFVNKWSPVRSVALPHSFPLRHTATPVR